VPERDSSGQPSVEEQLRALYDNAESGATRAFEQAVSSASFGALLARSAENVAALSRIGADVADLVLRNLRVAGRADITRLARQLHRTEDKLERVLQEIEQLRDEIAAADTQPAATRGEAEDDVGRRAGSGRGSAPASPSASSSRRADNTRRATAARSAASGRATAARSAASGRATAARSATAARRATAAPGDAPAAGRTVPSGRRAAGRSNGTNSGSTEPGTS
jgi:hypothetical protein